MASEIRPGVFLGDAKCLQDTAGMGITHVLATAVQDTFAPSSEVTTKELDLRDEEEENILQHFPAMTSFIDGAVAGGGKVLVYCLAGMSRSVSAVVAWLMTKEGLDSESALAAVRGKHPQAGPNDGFLRQLAMFGDMGCVLDREHPGFKAFNAEQLGRRWQEEGWVDSATLNNPEEDGAAGTVMYRCRKCRRLLSTQANVLEHERGGGNTSFSWKKRDKQTRDVAGSKDGCHSMFVEPMRWMEGISEGVHEGKIACANPKCGAKLGTFNWAGEQCNCGAWVVPFFQLQKSRIDTVLPPAALPPVRMAAPRVAASWKGDGPAPSPARYRHLIFDCDGVLVNTEVMSCGALHRAILKVTGVEIPHDFPTDFYPVMGMDVRSCVQHYKDSVPAPQWEDVGAIAEAVSSAKEGIYRELTEAGIDAFDGARDLAERAAAAGMTLAVGSSGTPEKIAHNLSSSGLEDLFEKEKVVSAKYVARGKPAPDVYVEAMRRVGCTDPSTAIVIEDAVHGLRAARAAGAFAIGITNSLPRELLEPHADLVVSSLSEVRPGELPARRETVPAEEAG